MMKYHRFFEPPSPPGLSTTFTAENELYKEFPFAEKYKLKFKMENDRLKVGLIAPKKTYLHFDHQSAGERGIPDKQKPSKRGFKGPWK